MLYALAHVPTVWALRDPVAGLNPIVILAALGCRLVWGGMARHFERLLPVVISQVLFDWVVVTGCGGRAPEGGLSRIAPNLAALFLFLSACHGAGATDAKPPRAVSAGEHLQVVRAMTMADRTRIVARFRQRNAGESWSFNEDALEGVVVVDPFRGFLRRGQRQHVLGTRGVSPENAAAAARGFVEKNADLLGLPLAVVHALAEDQSSAGDRWSVRFTATYPSRGYAFTDGERSRGRGIVSDRARSPVRVRGT